MYTLYACIGTRLVPFRVVVRLTLRGTVRFRVRNRSRLTIKHWFRLNISSSNESLCSGFEKVPPD